MAAISFARTPRNSKFSRWRFVMRNVVLLLACLFLAASGLAQTKAPVKKAAASPMATVVASGSEKWGDVPAAAMVGTPSVEMGGKIQLAVVQGNPMQAGTPYT